MRKREDRKYIEKDTYSHQPLGSSTAQKKTRKSRVKMCFPHVWLKYPLAFLGLPRGGVCSHLATLGWPGAPEQLWSFVPSVPGPGTMPAWDTGSRGVWSRALPPHKCTPKCLETSISHCWWYRGWLKSHSQRGLHRSGTTVRAAQPRQGFITDRGISSQLTGDFQVTRATGACQGSSLVLHSMWDMLQDVTVQGMLS